MTNANGYKNIDSDRIWKDAVMGVVVGDALGCPVQFLTRKEVARNPVTTMRGHGTFDLPAGSWTDDSSMTLALLSSIRENKMINLSDIMRRFARWMYKGEYTPYGFSYDIGRATMNSVERFAKDQDVKTCGGTSVHDNGNGSLMRIMPACLYCFQMQETAGMTDEQAVMVIHKVAGLTHNHMRAKIACGLYYFMVRSILREEGELKVLLQRGLDEGFAYYKKDVRYLTELAHYGRLRNLSEFADVKVDQIRSSGYVVDTIEAAVWCLLQTDCFELALLVAVNLGDDTDTVGAICGGLAGLYYGYESIPEDWLAEIKRRDWIESLCEKPLG